MKFQRTWLLNFQQGWGHVPHSTTPLPPGKCTSGAYFFALAAVNGPLTAELKFRENTAMLTHSEQKRL